MIKNDDERLPSLRSPRNAHSPVEVKPIGPLEIDSEKYSQNDGQIKRTKVETKKNFNLSIFVPKEKNSEKNQQEKINNLSKSFVSDHFPMYFSFKLLNNSFSKEIFFDMN